jgi:hypothetical protein
MKKIKAILVAVVVTATVWAQTPQKMSYQAVIRNGSALVVNQSVGIKISILQGSVSGTAVYTETQTPSTNGNGLVSVEIGSGAGFSTINWANGLYFIKTETDPTGGTSYTVTNTNQLLSVPYALYAEKAGSVSGHYLGEEYLGGIIFSIYKGSDGVEHGLIVSKTEQNKNWQPGSKTTVNADRTWDGVYNTNLMPAESSAKSWVASLGAGWYLPSIDELNILWQNRFFVNNSSASGLTKLQYNNDPKYWSSTEKNTDNSFIINFQNGNTEENNKNDDKNSRGILKF